MSSRAPLAIAPASLSAILRRGPRDWRFSLYGMQETVRPECFDGLDESEAVMKAEPCFGVATPLDIEAIEADPVEAGEGGLELLAEIFRETRAVALDEAIIGAAPFAENIDWIVELRRPDHWQESRLQEFVDQSFANRGDAGFFGLGECGGRLKRFAHGSPLSSASSMAAIPRAASAAHQRSA
jgi:hypothetical protein